jgi:hypothetical protein
MSKPKSSMMLINIGRLYTLIFSVIFLLLSRNLPLYGSEVLVSDFLTEHLKGHFIIVDSNLPPFVFDLFRYTYSSKVNRSCSTFSVSRFSIIGVSVFKGFE